MLNSANTDLAPLGGIWDPFPPSAHGGGYVAPGRLVAYFPDHTWPHTPETCQSGPFDNTWHLDGTVLLCNGCGIDAT